MKRVITVATLALGLTWSAAAASHLREQATGAHADHSQQPKTMATGGAMRSTDRRARPHLRRAAADHRTAGGCPQGHREIPGRPCG